MERLIKLHHIILKVLCTTLGMGRYSLTFLHLQKQRKRGKPSKKRKKQEAGAVHLEGIVDQPEAPIVDFKSLVTPEVNGSEGAED